MKTFTTVFITGLLSVLLPSAVLAQSSQGPFDDLVGKEIRSDNIFLLWQEMDQNSELKAFQKVFRYDPEADVDQSFSNIPTQGTDQPVGGNRHMAIASGKYIDGLFDHVVAAWEGENQTIELMIPHFDTTDVMWNSHTTFTVDGPVVQTDGNNERGRIFIESGDMNGNGRDEFVLVYHGADSTIHVEVYELDEDLTPQLLASINDEELLPTPIDLAKLSVAVGDVNGNGRDEIILSSVAITGTQSWAWGIYVKNYELDGTNNLADQAREIIFLSDPDEMQISGMDLAVEAGNFRDSSEQDIVLAMTFSTNEFEDDTFIYLIELDEGTGTFEFDPENRVSMQKSVNERGIIDLAVGDLNNNSFDEFVFGLAGSFEIYSVNENLTPEFRSSGPISDNDEYRLSYEFLDVSDLDQDEKPEIISARNVYDPNSSEQRFEISAYSIYDSQNGILDSLSLKARRQNSDPAVTDGNDSRRRYALATGRFDGDSFTLGEPDYSVKTDDIQPIVILNAPPIHFDIFEGAEYDISNCSPVSNCAFNAQYLTSEEETSTVTTEVRSDFAISAGIGFSGSLSAEPLGVGVSVNQEAYFDANYGQNFSEKGEEGESITITERITATVEDRIYASIADYDIWEYPVYEGAQEVPTRYILAMEPKNVRNQWFSSKSWNANRYIPSHEVGNILSYPTYGEVTENPDISHSIYNRPNSYQLDNSSDAVWELDISNFSSTEQDTTREIGYNAKVHLGAYRFSSAGSRDTLSTHKTTVKNRFNVTVDLKNLDLSYGESRYNVTPYVYWNNNDALVIDYAAEPERSADGGVKTWWEDFYGNEPDPAFILPWRYDPEKGLGLSEEIRRFRTKDIFFDNYEPSAGDTLTISARIRNFSLVESPPATATFYVGDPDEGGELITGIEGESVVSTPDDIEAQRYSDVELQWILPSGLPDNPRIFAVLNEDSEYDEIHQNNNKAYNILNSSGVITSNDGLASTQPQTFELHQAYPNPFNPTTTIGYELPQNTQVRLDVFNILGQRVATLVNEVQPTGLHEVQFDASNLSSGVYLYRLTTDQSVQSQKMILLK